MRHLCDFACFLAKQVLSQMNYTPTGTFIDLKAFAVVRKTGNGVKIVLEIPLAGTLLRQSSRHFVCPAIDSVRCFLFICAFICLPSSGNRGLSVSQGL
jgi:hypothetical protein